MQIVQADFVNLQLSRARLREHPVHHGAKIASAISWNSAHSKQTFQFVDFRTAINVNVSNANEGVDIVI